MNNKKIATWSGLAVLFLLVSSLSVSALIDKDYNPMADDIERIAGEQAAAAGTGDAVTVEEGPPYLLYGLIAIVVIAIAAFLMKSRKK